MSSTLTPAIVGQTEKAHTAILTRALADTTLDERQWITLNVAVGADQAVDRGDHVSRVAGLTTWNPAVVEQAVVQLVESDLLTERADGHIEPSDAGRALVGKIRAATGQIVARAYGVISPEDLATAARVLSTVTAELHRELAA